MFEPSKNLNPIVVEDVHVFNPKKWKKNFDINVNHKFQDVWALKMPWGKPIFNEIRLVISMKCHVCFKIEKTSFWWLNGIPLRSMKVKGKFLMENGLWIQNVGMQKNEIAYVKLLTKIILQQLDLG